METRIETEPGGGYVAITRIDAAFVGALTAELPRKIAESVGKQLAQEFMAEKGRELLAKIPLDAVLNIAVAEVVMKINAAHGRAPGEK